MKPQDSFGRYGSGGQRGIGLEASDICTKESGATTDFHSVRLFYVVNPSALGGGGCCRPLLEFSFQVLYIH